MKLAQVITGVLVLSTLIAGCGSSITGNSVPAIGAPIQVGGTLGGAPLLAVEMSVEEQLRLDARDEHVFGGTLGGNTVQCLTLSSPVTSGNTTTDSFGNFTLTLNAFGIPFSCYITPSGGSTLIPVTFSNGTSTALMASVSGSQAAAIVNLGTITLTGTQGSQVATATLPSTAALVTTTPSNLGCLPGTWTGTNGSCGGSSTTLTMHVTALPTGTYSGSYLTANAPTNVYATGTLTASNTCISAPSSTSGLSVGMSVSDTTTGHGSYIPAGTTVASLPATGICSGGIVLSANATNAATTDSLTFTSCAGTGTYTGPTVSSVNFSSANNTVTITHTDSCLDLPYTTLASAAGACTAATTNNFTGTLANATNCVTVTAGGGLPTLLSDNDQVTGTGIPSGSIWKTALCTGSQYQLSKNAASVASGDSLTDTTANVSFGGTLTANSPCVSLAFPSAFLDGDTVSGTGITTGPAWKSTLCTSGQLQLSANAIGAATGDVLSDAARGVTFGGALTLSSPCVTAALPSVVATGDSVTCANGTGTCNQTASQVITMPGTCGAGNITLAGLAAGTGLVTLTDTTHSAVFTGTVTSGSACFTPAFPTTLAVADVITDSTTSGNINGSTKLASASGSCTAGQVQLSTPASASGTVAITDTSRTGASFTGTTTLNSVCVTNAFPTSLVAANDAISDSTTSGNIAASTALASTSGACTAGQAQLSGPATSSGTVGITDGTTAGGSFTGVATSGSVCVASVAPVLPGYPIIDSSNAIPAATTVVATSTCASGTLQLSANAGAAATSGETLVVTAPGNIASGCCTATSGGAGACFDSTGNGYYANAAGNSTCPAVTATTALSGTEIIPINSSCTEEWALATSTCVGAPNTANCGGVAPFPTFSGTTYKKTDANCAACLGVWNNSGCVGFGTVTCNATSNPSNVYLTKQ